MSDRQWEHMTRYQASKIAELLCPVAGCGGELKEIGEMHLYCVTCKSEYKGSKPCPN